MAQQERYPGYGIIYPQKSTKGLKYVRIVADGSKKVRNADGSFELLPPSPTVLELVGGAFCYVSGQVVNKREDLESLPTSMREKALQWFDSQRTIPKEAIVDAPEPADKSEPEAKWILSNERTDLLDLDDKPKDVRPITDATPPVKEESAILSALDAIMDKLNKHDKDIEGLRKSPPPPRRMPSSEAKHGKQSETMKAKWADPAYKAKMMDRRNKNKQEVTDVGRTAETSKDMQEPKV